MQKVIEGILNKKDYSNIDGLLHRAKVLGEFDDCISAIAGYYTDELTKNIEDTKKIVGEHIIDMIEKSATMVNGCSAEHGEFCIDNLWGEFYVVLGINDSALRLVAIDVYQKVTDILIDGISKNKNIGNELSSMLFNMFSNKMNRAISFDINLMYRDIKGLETLVVRSWVQVNLKNIFDKKLEIAKMVSKCTNIVWRNIDIDKYTDREFKEFMHDIFRSQIDESDWDTLDCTDIDYVNLSEQCNQLQTQKEIFAKAMTKFSDSERGIK